MYDVQRAVAFVEVVESFAKVRPIGAIEVDIVGVVFDKRIVL